MDQESEYLKRSDANGHLKVLEALRKWDPIGVISESNQDEYDPYAPTIVRMLDARCSAKQLAKFLYDLKTQHMGLSGSWFMTDEKRIARVTCPH